MKDCLKTVCDDLMSYGRLIVTFQGPCIVNDYFNFQKPYIVWVFCSCVVMVSFMTLMLVIDLFAAYQQKSKKLLIYIQLVHLCLKFLLVFG